MTAVATGSTGTVQAPRTSAPRRLLGAVGRLAISVAAGLALLAAFPEVGLWWLAPVAVAAIAAVTFGCRPAVGAWLGLAAGLACFLPLLAWTNLHTGVVPWVLLAGSQAAFLALLGAASAACSPLLVRWPVLAGPVTGALWVGQEALRDRLPFGGFPWGRLAFSQGDSPLLGWAALGGAPLVTFMVGVAGGALAGVVLLAARVRAGGGGRRLAAVGVADADGTAGTAGSGVGAADGTAGTAGSGVGAADGAAGGRAVRLVAACAVVGVAACGGGGLVPRVGGAAGRSVTVAIVQGNVPRLGLDFNEQRRAVLDNHVAGTLELATKVAAGAVPRPDLVVWPENSSDIDPLVNADAAGRIGEAAQAIGVPILVGAVLNGGDVSYNAGLLWQPGAGVVARYVKRHPVPFAEYIPLRRVARLVSDQVDRVQVPFAPGHGTGVFRVGPARVGDVICFEVAYDDLVRDTVLAGAGLLVVQTNNATFDPAEAAQQMAMVRLRAVEHGRWALMASTVGISGFVSPDGRVWQATRFNTAAVVVQRVRLVDERRLATVLGPWPEVLLAVAGLLAVLAAWRLRRRAAACGEVSW